MPGPQSYTPPGVYTDTKFEAASANVGIGLRVPVFIGVGTETLPRTDFEMVRGSSAVSDNLISNEDVDSSWVVSSVNPQSPVLGTNDGTLRQFQVANYPIVTGSGHGVVSNSSAHVSVTVNGNEAEVTTVAGLLGLVTLKSFTSATDDVRVTYNFNRTDTQFTDNVSAQCDGTVTKIKVFNVPIVDGSNGGITTTDPNDVVVKVDGVAVTVSTVSGSLGEIDLAVAPSSNSTVLVTYYQNTWQDTFDYLPNLGINEVVRVGLSPNDNSYITDVDYVVKNQTDGPSKIFWGSSYRIDSEISSDGSTALNTSQITALLIDTMVYLDETTAYVDPNTSITSTTVFQLTRIPTLGNGRSTTLGSDVFDSISNGRIDLATDRPELVIAYVGQDIIDAKSRPAVTVTKVDGLNRLITLATSVQPNETVFATYWTNYLTDDEYTVTNTLAGASGTGTYNVSSQSTNAQVLGASFISKTSISQTLNWGTGTPNLIGVFHDGSGLPVEEFIEIAIDEQAARGATLLSSVDGVWDFVTGVSDKLDVSGTPVTLTGATVATVTSSLSETYDLDGLTMYLRSEQSSTLTEIIFLGNTLSAEDVADQINGAMRTGTTSNAFAVSPGVVPGADTGVVASDSLGDVVLTSANVGDSATIVIGVGTADAILGFTSSSNVTGASVNATTAASDINGALTGITATVVGDGIRITDDTTGLASTLVLNAIANSAYALMGFEDGQTDGGEDAYSQYKIESYLDDGFTIAHSEGTGTGSSNIGVVGQTYIDEVTGVRISLLEPEDAAAYDDAGTIRFNVLKEFTTDSANPVYAFLGTEVKVSNTTGVGVGDTAIVETFDKAGNEPSVGDYYYITYTYDKTDYSAKTFTSLEDIVAEYGVLDPSNRLSLAMHLALANGAALVAGKQVVKETGGDDATVTSYIEAIDSLRKPIERTIKPSFIVPVTTEPQVIAFAKTHCIVQSSARWRQERVCIFGFASGTTPQSAQIQARSYSEARCWAVYPDACVISITDVEGNEVEYIVDGSFAASAVAGTAVSSAYDVATPYVNRSLVGIKRFVREMDVLEKDQTTNAGIILLEDRDPSIVIRDAYTTDLSSTLTREPTVITIADYIEQRSRTALAQFIGQKSLGGHLGDIERVVRAAMNKAVTDEIITDFTAVKATASEVDPTAIRVSLAYRPVGVLKYIYVNFTVTTR